MLIPIVYKKSCITRTSHLKYLVDDLLRLLTVDGHGDLLGGVHAVQLAHQLRLALLQQRGEHLESLVYLRLGHLNLEKERKREREIKIKYIQFYLVNLGIK